MIKKLFTVQLKTMIFICLCITCSFASDQWGTMYEQVIPSSASANLDLHLDPSGSQTITDSEKLIIVAYPSCADCTPKYYWKATGGDIIGQPNTRKITWRPPDVSDIMVFYIYCTLQDGKGHNKNDFVQVIVTDSGEPPYIDPDSDYIDPIVSIVTVTSRNLIVNQPATIIWNATDNQTADEQLSIQIEHLRPDGSGWDVVNSNTPNTGSIIWTPTETGTDLRVRVCATDADGNQSAWVESDVFDVIAQGSNPTNCSGNPETPILYDPGISTPNNWFDLSWRKIGDATSYVLQESESLSFNAATEQTFSGTDNCTASFTNKANGIYYYRVKSVNSCGESDWSAFVDIEVKVHSAPLPPINPSPADNATNISLTPTLIWDERDSDADSNPLDYYVVLGTDPNAMNTVRAYGSGGSIYPVISSPLEPATTSYWQVTVRDANGLKTQGPIWKFTTVASGPDLEPSNFIYTGTYGTGETLDVSVTVKNIGNLASTGGYVEFFYSSTSDGEDYEFRPQQKQLPDISAGDSIEITANLLMPQIRNGTSYLVAKVRTSGYFSELSVENNSANIPMDYTDVTPPEVSYFNMQWPVFEPDVYKTGQSVYLVYTALDDIQTSTANLYYSIDDGVSWTEIVSGITVGNDGYNNGYAWTIPSDLAPTSLFKLKIETADGVGNISEAVAGPYEIIDGTAPEVTVVSPNGGEIWNSGSSHTISWSADESISQVEISVRRAGGSSVFSTTLSSNPGSTVWNIPSTIAGDFYVLIRVTDANNNEGEDISDDLFSVVDPSKVDTPFTDPLKISTSSNQTIGETDIAVGPTNDLHVVWSDNFNLYYRKRVGTSWGSVQQLTSDDSVYFNGQNHVLIEVDSFNQAHIIYKSTGNDLFYMYDTGSGFSSPINISISASVAYYRMAMDDDHIHLLFRDFSHIGFYRKIKAGTIDASASTILWNSQVNTIAIAVATSGDIYAFRGGDGLFVRRFTNGVWENEQELPNVIDGHLPCTRVDSKGIVHIIWRNLSEQTGVWYACLNKALEMSDPVLISSYLGFQDLVLDHNDFPVVSNGSGLDGYTFMTVIKNTGGNWLPAKFVSKQSQSASGLGALVIDSDNVIHIVYTGWDSGKQAVFYTYANADDFESLAPDISFSQPVAGDQLNAGNTFNIQWTATSENAITDYALYYSTDGGETYTMIDSSITGLSYDWDVPNVLENNVLLQLIATLNDGSNLSEESGVFRIIDSTSPWGNIIKPSDGSIVESGTDQEIIWTINDNIDVESLILFYSLDGGNSWGKIAEDIANSGLYIWTVPGIQALSAKIKIVAVDSQDNQATIVSDTFTISRANSAPHTPWNPSPLNQSYVGTDLALEWSGGDQDYGDTVSYDIYFGLDNPPASIFLSGLESNSYSLSSLEIGKTYYWRIVASDGKAVSQGPIWTFSTGDTTLIAAPSELNSISVSSSAIDLTWSDNSDNEDGFKIERKIGEDGAYSVIATNGSNTESFNDTELDAHTEYFYRIRAVKDTAVSLYSPESVSITRNDFPDTPSNPIVTEATEDDPLDLILGWTGGDANGDALTYDVYFGATPTPSLVSTSQSDTTYTVNGLDYNQLYFWKVVVTDTYNGIAEGPLWHFVTDVEPVPENPSSLSAIHILRYKVELDWIAGGNNPIGFVVERKDGVSGAFELIGVTDKRYFTDTDNILVNNTYYYRVRAYNSSGYSNYTSEVILNIKPRAGDIDYNGTVNLSDAVLVLKILVGPYGDNEVFPQADVNGDNKIGIADAAYILRKISGGVY